MNASTTFVSAPATLAARLLECAPDDEQRLVLHRLRRQVIGPLLVAGTLVALWSAWAPLSGAVVASGHVQAALGRKVVQHQEGGIVRSLLVRQGQAVRRGEALLVVGDVRSDAALDMLRKQADAERLRSERARAEMSLAPAFTLPADLKVSPEMQARERALFESRRRTLDEQLAAMQSQAQQARAQIGALAGQLQASQRSAELAREELGINSELVASGFVSKARLLMLERGVADTAMRAEASRGQIAEAQQQVSALGNAMAQARGAYQQRAADELKEATARLRELEDRLRPSQDQFDRQTVRAPVDGTVMALRVGAVGTAVGPREPLLEIAPSQERLVVELRIDPHDIEHVRQGDAAEVRLSAFEARSTPLLPAVVTSVSPDAVTESGGKQSWYAAQVEVKADALAAHPQLRLQAGMPAEVFVTTPPRSLLRYLLEPLGVFGRRALREP
ncbi:Type I secretion system membrane fusion protein PrsE [Burkholderiaceae bacterium]|nr:Type I secretion system membrane fusion protein PrsE [Burkholderiaceae bacterium]